MNARPQIQASSVQQLRSNIVRIAMRRPNVEVIRSTAGSHGLVPVHHLPERLAGRRR
jgi:hypothetical protein